MFMIVIILIINFFWKGEDVKFTRGEVISIWGGAIKVYLIKNLI